ncbi:hypothetical protein CHS0354_017369 [Potamilus streckersoni]|uniref:Uncharacterized protein n=1 Tax=Potamilus streckersoni TaxID=2493646 RepID=A0AAE0T5N7_9BIVA|nr:hypothetical protein CHS0354_017369 [Potamilus streckersoni]
MTSSKPSDADKWREEGNNHYKSVDENMSPPVNILRLQKSLICYQKSRTCSTCESETASASKNLALTNWKLAMLSYKAGEKWLLVKLHFEESFKYFNEACRMGERTKNQLWIDNILASSRSCWGDMLSLVDSTAKERLEKARIIQEVIHLIPAKDIQADCYLDIARIHFHSGITAIETGNYSDCLYQMKECYYPLNEAARVGIGLENIQQEVRILEDDVNMHTCIAKAMQSRATGDNIFQTILMDEELLNVDMVWEVIDWYKDSILQARDLDIKLEAISLSRLGTVYNRVLKIQFKAKEYLKKSIELAQSLRPMDVTSEDWYQNCTQILEKYQQESLMQEQEDVKKKKESVLTELAPELNFLKAREEEPYDTFLTWLYGTFPPKNPLHKLELTKKEEEDDFQVKYRCLQKAIIHYHPDRVDEAKFGLKCKVLYEEITKRLTKRYEQVKV